MSERTALLDLASFIGRSSLVSDDMATRNRALAGVSKRMLPRHGRRGVAELLGVVLALSARTRRMVQEPVRIDLDVFAPGGKRAVRISFGGER